MVWGGLGCVLGYLQSGAKLRTQKGGHAKKTQIVTFITVARRARYREKGGKCIGGGRVGDMGEWSVREMGEVRGFGGSTGCPECKVVGTGKKAEKECQNACIFLFSNRLF